MKKIDFSKHIWEGWTVGDFIKELEPLVAMIMRCDSWVRPFGSKSDLADWCKDNQPYYKKPIPEVADYFAQKYNIK